MHSDEKNPNAAQAAFFTAIRSIFPDSDKSTTTILDVLVKPYLPESPHDPAMIEESWLITVRLVISGKPR